MRCRSEGRRFDISRQSEQEVDAIKTLFYKRLFQLEEENPQAALLQLLTIPFEPPSEAKLIFPGEAMFAHISDWNSPLVIALLNRAIDLQATNEDGNIALHVAAAHGNNADIATRLLQAGSDVNAIGNGGELQFTTPRVWTWKSFQCCCTGMRILE